MKYFFKYIKPLKFKILIYFALVSITWAISLIQPYLSSILINSLIERKNYSYIKLIILLIIIISIAFICSSYILGITETKLINLISYSGISDVINYFQHLPLSKINIYDPVYITQRIKGDVTTIITFLLKDIITITMNILCVIVSLIFLLNISNSFIYFIIFYLPIYLLLYKIIRKPLYEKGYKAKDSSDQFSKILTQQMLFIKTIKINSSFSKSLSLIREQFNNMFINVIDFTKYSYIFSSLDNIVTIAFQVTVFIVFAKKVYLNQISIGDFTIINTYFSLIISSIKYFIDIVKSYQDVKISKKRLEMILCQSKEHNGNRKLNTIQSISIENLSFSYHSDKENKILVFDNINLYFEKNFIYLIKGKNGSGKSTLFDLIIGLYQQELNSGIIKINDINIESIDMYWLRSFHIGFISQIVYYGSESVLEFLAYKYFDNKKLSQDSLGYNTFLNDNTANGNLSDKIISLVKDNNLEYFFLNDYFNIVKLLGRKMSELSGGQQKKILILREILTDPNILFFDEPEAALDKKSILDLKKVIQNIKNNKLIFIVSHDDYFNDIADKEIILNSH